MRVGGRECPGHPSHEPCIRCTTLDWEVYQWTHRALALEDTLRVIVGRKVLCPKDQERAEALLNMKVRRKP